MKQSVLVCLSCLAAQLLFGNEFSNSNELSGVLRAAPAPELPRLAADLVKRSPAIGRIDAAREIVRQAVRRNPAAAVAIVGAVARAEPGTAAGACESAARERPDLAAVIATAASAAAPARVTEIVSAACKVAPTEYRTIALAVSRVLPAESDAVLTGVAEARPDLRPFIQRELEAYSRPSRSVSRCLYNAERALSSQGRPRPGNNGGALPQAGSPRPKSGPPGQGGPPRGNGNPPGGRNYARP